MIEKEFMKRKTLEKRLEGADELIKFTQKQINDDFSFFLNLVHCKRISNLELLDTIVEIVSMYRVSIIYEYFFVDFLPNFIRNTGIGIASVLTILCKMTHCITSDLSGSTMPNIYARKLSKQNIIEVNSPLFEEIYTHSPVIMKREPFEKASYASFKLRSIITSFSPSQILKYPFVYKLESEITHSIDYIFNFFKKMLPIFIMLENKPISIIETLKSLMNVTIESTHKFSLETFCKFNLTILGFITSLKRTQKPEKRQIHHDLDLLVRKLIFFNIDYFGRSIYSKGRGPENFHISLNSVESSLRNLSRIY